MLRLCTVEQFQPGGIVQGAALGAYAGALGKLALAVATHRKSGM